MVTQTHPVQTHPVLSCAAAIEAALKDVTDLDPTFMGLADKRVALLRLSTLVDQLDELGLRVLAASADVADADGARDAAAWLAHHTRRDPSECRRRLHLAQRLAGDRAGVARALREGRLNHTQAEVIVHSLHTLPTQLGPEVMANAETRLIDEAATFGPRELRVLGRRIVEVVAPEIGEGLEAEALAREENTAARKTHLSTRRNGDGTTDLRIRVADLVADRLLTYLHAFTNPRQSHTTPPDAGDQQPYDQQLGHAFGAFLETIDPTRLPLHGGTATTVIITIDLDTLTRRLGTALIGDTPTTAAHARRLACNANLIPAVLNGTSQILDLGRTRRLFSPAQRTAIALRDTTCRAEGCDIPAPW